jgi:two-component system sensor histidine kinase BarA
MDGSMPHLDGFEAARIIRSQEAERGLKPVTILAFTAHVLGASAEAWREAGMNGVLHKPFTLDKLAEAIAAQFPSISDTAPAEAPLEPAQAERRRGERRTDLLDAETIGGLKEMAALSGDSFIGRVLGLYRDHAPPALDLLKRAAAAGDAVEAGKAAHGLKSMSMNIGAARLAARLADIESAARNAGSVPAPTDLVALGSLLDQTMAALEERLSVPAIDTAVEQARAALAS